MGEFSDMTNSTETTMVRRPGWGSIFGSAFLGARCMTKAFPQSPISPNQFGIGDVFMVEPGLPLVKAFVLTTREADEVLKTVIVPNTVDMVDMMALRNGTMRALPNQKVLGAVGISLSPDHDVTILAAPSPAPPAACLASAQEARVVPMNKSLREANVLTPLGAGCLRRRRSFTATAFAETRGRLPSGGRYKSGLPSHVSECTCSRPMTLDKTGHSIRVLLAPRRERLATSASASIHAVSIHGRKEGVKRLP